ncbi:MAG TPA: ATP-binding cassette domain-containing protein, partial [Ilumatobacter sp.]
MSVALSVTDLTVRYGGLVANDSVCLEVRAGQVVGLIGPNGAGKSTFVDAVCGFTPYAGSVVLRDRPLDRLPPHTRRRLGLSRTWQSVELFDDLSVRANVAAAHR